LLVYADDVNLLGDNIDTIKKNTETLIDASKEVGLEVKAGSSPECRQNHNMLGNS
jgi:nitrate/TMAO reductase-like tetraheme cytochrome c subunit